MTGAGATVRAFSADDIAPANALTNWYIEHTAIHFGDRAASDAEFESSWRSGATDYPWLTIAVDGRFAGYAKAARWRERAAYARTAESAIYIARDAQGRGVGKVLYGALLQELRQRGFRTTVGGIALPNEPSVRLHEALGFRLVGVFRGVGCKFGRWHDVGFWQFDFGA